MSLFGGLWVGGFFILFLECTTKCTEYVHVHTYICKRAVSRFRIPYMCISVQRRNKRE